MLLRLKLVWWLCFIVLLCLDGSMQSGFIARTPSRPAASAPAPSEHADLLVFAPRPDDESLGCASVILQAVEQRKTVKVVVFTNGDGFPAAAAALTGKPTEKLTPADYRELGRRRQLEVAHATAILGMRPDDLILLGYPDEGLDYLYHQRDGTPYRSEFTEATTTYAIVKRDYHSDRHGTSAPYTHAGVLADVEELIKSHGPSEVYVTNQFDGHPDHRAAYWFVHDAGAVASYHGAFYTYLIHGPEDAESEWPWPHAITPLLPFAVHQFKGMQIPQNLFWPPPRRVPLTPKRAQEKLHAIRAHLSRENAASKKLMPDERASLEAFVKCEEIFWPGGKVTGGCDLKKCLTAATEPCFPSEG